SCSRVTASRYALAQGLGLLDEQRLDVFVEEHAARNERSASRDAVCAERGGVVRRMGGSCSRVTASRYALAQGLGLLDEQRLDVFVE
ncbi:MAG TPA: hypothetical protein VFE07_14100, partial [Marmoricola sp.]|nr:hypothetical protein [Marmoricola sp.]